MLLVLVMVALLSLAGYTFCQLMQSEREAVELAGRQAQALALAESGIEAARVFLNQERQMQSTMGGCYDNPERFRGVVVADDPMPHARGRFTLVAPDAQEGFVQGVRFGLEDQSGRLNLNVLPILDKRAPGSARQILMGLPGMTEQIADAILDWLDADDEPRDFGAERDAYSSLDPPLAPRNGPLATIEELLLVQGVTPGLLFGADTNRNGVIDPGEQDALSMEGVDNSDGSMSRGWAAYLTLHSMERNVRADGTAKINLNQSDLEQLYQSLSETLGEDCARFVVAYRQNGPYTPPEQPQQNQATGPATGELDLTQPAKTSLSTVLDLIGAKTQVTFKGQRNPSILDSPFPNTPGEMSSYLPAIMETMTCNPNKVIPGRININQAPRVVLLGIPGMDEQIVDQIIAQRQQDAADADSNLAYETWILAEGIVTLEQMKSLIPFICAGGDVYRVESVGYFDEGGVAARIEAIIDATKRPPRVVFWRDISHLGRGYAPEILGAQ